MRKKRTWKRPAHGGGHLENKKQTPAEFASTQRYFTDAKARWDWLFSPERNRWKPDDKAPQGWNASPTPSGISSPSRA